MTTEGIMHAMPRVEPTGTGELQPRTQRADDLKTALARLRLLEEKRMSKHIASDFDEFLAEQGMRGEVEAAAVKRVIAWQLAVAKESRGVTKTEMVDRTVARLHEGIECLT